MMVTMQKNHCILVVLIILFVASVFVSQFTNFQPFILISPDSVFSPDCLNSTQLRSSSWLSNFANTINLSISDSHAHLLAMEDRRLSSNISTSNTQIQMIAMEDQEVSSNALPSDAHRQSTAIDRKVSSSESLYSFESFDHLASWRLNPEGLAPLTQWVQDEIYRHQHPNQCTNVVFTPGWKSGFGSEIHVIGSHLAFAIEHGQVLVWGSEACRMMAAEPCGANRCICFFKALSNCSIETVTGTVAGHHPGLVPSKFKAALKDAMPRIRDDQIKYWWRAQSAAYIARLNQETSEAVRRMRLDTSMHTFSGPQKWQFPLPEGTINAHIRAGDKAIEMKLVAATVYAKEAHTMVINNPFDFRSRTLFVSSDDDGAIRSCGAEIETYEGWTWVQSHIERMKDGFKLGEAMRNVNFTRQVILQLLMSLEADAWIGTRGSNWCRLVDELRCIWVDKCDRPFVEVGDFPENYEW